MVEMKGSRAQTDAVVEVASFVPGQLATPAFDAYFERNHPDLFAALWLITRDRAEADEIAQEAFLRVWERWDRVSTMANPEGYLYRTAMNVFRSRKRRAALAVRRIAHPRAPEDEVLLVERRELLVQLLGTLTPRERAALVLTDLLGYSSEEAAGWLGIKPATVRVLTSRARNRMQQEVSDDEP